MNEWMNYHCNAAWVLMIYTVNVYIIMEIYRCSIIYGEEKITKDFCWTHSFLKFCKTYHCRHTEEKYKAEGLEKEKGQNTSKATRDHLRNCKFALTVGENRWSLTL